MVLSKNREKGSIFFESKSYFRAHKKFLWKYLFLKIFYKEYKISS